FYSIDQLRHLRETLCANQQEGLWQPLYEVAILEALKTANREFENHVIRRSQSSSAPAEIEKAEAEFRTMLTAEPNSPSAWRRFGDFLARETTRLEEAESAYRRAVELNGNDAIAWEKLGRLLRGVPNRVQESEIAYRRSVEINPDSASGWSGLG